eukprot:TRINITY_DN32869_c0_g1_i1.p1 TRINITY_DN32869_c0_g1~~TRINITY_DN32869_c0_g1_i1.p1  ORF type:complete len:118 (-),score=12.50 TRINITY_DN32869_c0_g1_i1:104-457(-)
MKMFSQIICAAFFASLSQAAWAGVSQGCSAGWSGLGNSCFKYFQSDKYWTSAQAYCESQGGNLASVHSAEENDFIQDLVMSAGRLGNVWVGGSDAASEGQWLVDGWNPSGYYRNVDC